MTILCHFDDIPEGAARGFELGEDKLFAVKKEDSVYLYHNRCPHLGLELNWVEDQFLDLNGALIQCATHCALFVIEDGKCVAGPCLAQALEPIPFEIFDQQILLIP